MAFLFGRRKRRLPRVLIVETEPLVAFDNERFLQLEGFDVVATVDRVDRAVTMIAHGTPIDLVLAEVCLVDGTGIDVAQTAYDHGIPVLFVTNQCPGHARSLANGCLSKPYMQRDLLRAIEVIETVTAGTSPKNLPNGFSLFKDAA